MDRTTPWKGSRELQFNGNKISSGDGEIFLQMHSGDGYAILQILLSATELYAQE